MSDRYKFYQISEDTVVCVTDYLGKRIKRYAKCSPRDQFNYETGCKLAKARVMCEIARRRYNNSHHRCAELAEAVNQVHREWMDCCCFELSAMEEFNRRKNELSKLESSLLNAGRTKSVMDGSACDLWTNARNIAEWTSGKS